MSEEQPVDTNEQIAIRRQKLNELREQGRAYPNGFERDTLSSDITEKCEGLEKEAIAELELTVTIAGRIMTRRNMGKASFITIQDVNGRVQVYVKGDLLEEGVYDDFKRWDIGDIIGVTGQVFMTNKGEISVRAKKLTLLTKST